MKSKNICKFVPADMTGQLMPTRFILETNPSAMRHSEPKPTHRIVLITNQSGKLNLNTASYPCSVGNVIILFENETYFFEGEVGFQYMYIDFKGLRANDLFRHYSIFQILRCDWWNLRFRNSLHSLHIPQDSDRLLFRLYAHAPT